LTECYSALCRKQREGILTAKLRQQAWTRLEGFFVSGGIQLIPVTEPILERANQILEQCLATVPLRSLDAIHLACCQRTGVVPLFSNDQRVRQAATLLNIPLAPLPPAS